jgi:hypothetical protein
VFGETLGAPMNVIPAFGVYGALLRAQDQPLHYPGNPQIRVAREACDSELLAEAFAWGATESIARNQIYNVSNGDQFDWFELWDWVAAGLGMARGGVRPIRLAEEIPLRADDWRAVVAAHDLLADPDPMAIGGASFGFVDGYLGALEPEVRRTGAQLMSTIKIRRHGFSACADTGEMVVKWLHRLQDRRVLPPRTDATRPQTARRRRPAR